jgi:hypothetical protein
MPRFNSRGDWCAGIGGGSVRVNDTQIATNAGQACWLDDDHVLYQQGAHLETYNVRTGAYVRDFDAEGANEIAAGGGVYAAKFSGVLRVKHLDGSVSPYPGYFVGDVGPDGSFVMLGPDGTVQGQVVRFVQVLGGGAWSGLDSNYRPVQSPGVSVPQVIDGRTYGFRRAGAFCCYQTEDARLIVQHIDRKVGKVFRNVPNAYRPDLVQRGDQLCVIYATDEGEAVNVPLGPFPISELTELLSTSQPPTVNIPPPTVNIPQPEPKPVPVANQLATVERVRAKYPTPLGAQHPAFLIELAKATGAKLLRKDNGTHVTLPNGVNVSQDILGFGDGAECYDVLGDGENAATPGWGAKGAIAGEWIDVSGFGVPTTGTTVPTSGTPASPGAALDAHIAALTARIAALEARPLPTPQTPQGAVSLTGKRVAIKTDNGHWLTAEDGGGSTVVANRTEAGGWEIFTLEEQS